MTERIPSRPPEGGPKEPTHEQLSAAQVSFVLSLDDIMKRKAQEHHSWNENKRLRNRLRIRQTRTALVDLYVLQYADLSLDKFKKKWGTETRVYEQLLEDVQPEIDATRINILEHAAEITPEERRDITKRALRKLHERHHRKNLVAVEGTTQEERRVQRSKFIKAGVLTIPTTVAANAIVAASIAYEARHPTVPFGPITDWKTLLTVAASYGANYLSLYANYRSQMQLLNNPDIQTGPSIGAKAAHYTTTTLLPENAKLTKRAVGAATAIPSLWQEPFLILGLLAPGVGPLAVVGRNLGGTVFNAAEATSNELYLGYRKVKQAVSKRRRERIEKSDEDN